MFETYSIWYFTIEIYNADIIKRVMIFDTNFIHLYILKFCYWNKKYETKKDTSISNNFKFSFLDYQLLDKSSKFLPWEKLAGEQKTYTPTEL